MVRFSSILVVYFVVAAVMFGAGAITWNDAGVAQYMIDNPEGDTEEETVSQDVVSDLEKMGGPIGNVVGVVGGGLLAIWGFLNGLIGLVFWPVIVLLATDAPSRIVVLAGGTLSVAFVAGVLRTIRGSI